MQPTARDATAKPKTAEQMEIPARRHPHTTKKESRLQGRGQVTVSPTIYKQGLCPKAKAAAAAEVCGLTCGGVGCGVGLGGTSWGSAGRDVEMRMWFCGDENVTA
ncbi:hypothetical protein ACLOJK_039568 [Asimina triloba]